MAQDIDLSSSSPGRQVLEEAPQRAPKFLGAVGRFFAIRAKLAARGYDDNRAPPGVGPAASGEPLHAPGHGQLLSRSRKKKAEPVDKPARAGTSAATKPEEAPANRAPVAVVNGAPAAVANGAAAASASN
jgi:hypothetical protein